MIDSRIPLAGRTPDVAGTMQQGLLSGQQFVQNAQQHPLLMERQRIANETGQRNLDNDDMEKRVLVADTSLKFIDHLRSNVPQEQWAAEIEAFKQQGAQSGLGKYVESIQVPPDLSPAHLDQLEAQLRPFVDSYRSQVGGSGASSKAFAPVPMTDAEGNFTGYGMPVHDPRTGKATLEPVAAPDGQSFADPSKLAETKAAGAERGKLTVQSDLKPQLEADILRSKSEAELEGELSRMSATRRKERVNTLIDTGVASADLIPTYDRMLELIKVSNTGGVQAAIQRARQLFGWEAADMGELDALFKEAVLSNIRQMGSNPTEGERQFLMESGGSVFQNGAVTSRIIMRRKRSAEKDVETAKKYAKREGDQDALDIIDAALAPPSASGNPVDDLVNKYANP